VDSFLLESPPQTQRIDVAKPNDTHVNTVARLLGGSDTPLYTSQRS
jgi:hypothetical protein